MYFIFCHICTLTLDWHKEYITYKFGEQAALQLRYNNWSEDGGYSEEPVNSNFNEYVRQKENVERWLLTEEHLILSKPIIKDNQGKKWKRISDDWKNVINIYKTDIKEDEEDSKWLDEIIKLSNVRYEQSFRKMGVEKFYEAKRGDRQHLAREVAAKLGRELFEEWRTGTRGRSIFELQIIVEALMDSLEEKLNSFSEKIVRMGEGVDEQNAKLDENKRTWAKIGVFSAMAGKRKKVFDATAVVLEELYIYKTKGVGYQFAKSFVQELLQELQKLNLQIIEVGKKVLKAVEKFREGIDERLNEKYSMDDIPPLAFKQQIVKYYRPKLVKDVVEGFVKNEKIQKAQTTSVRHVVTEKLGSNPTFELFNKRISANRFLDILESTCGESAITFEQTLKESDKNKLLGVNIIQRLKERYEGNTHDLMIFIKKLVDFSGNYATFNENEIAKTGAGTKGANQQISSMTVILPSAPEHQEFHDELMEVFKKSKPAHIDDLEFIITDSRPFEITLVSITNLFPLRYLSIVEFLKDKYKRRISDKNNQRAKIEIHTDGDGSNLPNLFLEPKIPIMKFKNKQFLICY